MKNYLPEGLDKLRSLIEEVKIAMLCTKHTDHLRSRPMATLQLDEQGNIWFFTNEFSGKVYEISEDRQVCICYSNPVKNIYVCVMGKAELVTDWTKIKQLWNPIVRAWFPKGLDDPQLALLKVIPYEAEYWDNNSGKMTTLFKVLKEAIGGEKKDLI